MGGGKNIIQESDVGEEKSAGEIIKEEEVKEIKIEPQTVWIKDWNVLMYSNASIQAGVNNMLVKGDKVRSIARKVGWIKIDYNGQMGWVITNSVSKEQVIGIDFMQKQLKKDEERIFEEYIQKAKVWIKKKETDRREFELSVSNGSIKPDSKEYIMKTDSIYRGDGARYRYNSFTEYYSAYRINPNNLEVLKGLVTMSDSILDDLWWAETEGDEDWEKEIKEQYKNKSNLLIALCNRALALNPPEKEWWYASLASEYINRSPEISIHFSLKGLEYLEQNHDVTNEYYPTFLYRIADLSKDLQTKKKYYEKLMKNFPNWNLNCRDRININDIKREYKYLLKNTND